MSEFEQKSIDLQSQILAETQKQTQIETQFYATQDDKENKVATTFITIKETLKELFFAITPVIALLLPFSMKIQNGLVRVIDTIRDFQDKINEGFKSRQKNLESKERFRQKKFEKFLFDTLKFTIGVELIKGFFKIQFGLFKRFVLKPIMGLGKILGINKLLAVPLKAIQKGVTKLGNFVKDNLLKLALTAAGVLFFLKSDNPIIKNIRETTSKVLSDITSQLFGVEDTGSFLNTFKLVWQTKWLPTLQDGWDETVGGLKKWWNTPKTGGLAKLKEGWEFITDGVSGWWNETGLPAIKSTFDKVYKDIANFAEIQKNKFLYGTEEGGKDRLGEGVSGAIIGIDDSIKAGGEAFREQIEKNEDSTINRLKAAGAAIEAFTENVGFNLIQKKVDPVTGEVVADETFARQFNERKKNFFDGLIKFFSPDPNVVPRSEVFGSRAYIARGEREQRELEDKIAALENFPGLNLGNVDGTLFATGSDIKSPFRLDPLFGGAPIVVDGKTVYNNYIDAPNNFFNSATKHIYDINGANSGSGN